MCISSSCLLTPALAHASQPARHEAVDDRSHFNVFLDRGLQSRPGGSMSTIAGPDATLATAGKEPSTPCGSYLDLTLIIKRVIKVSPLFVRDCPCPSCFCTAFVLSFNSRERPLKMLARQPPSTDRRR